MRMRGSWLCLLGLAACNQSQSPATATRAGLQTVVGEDVSWTSVVNCAANGSTLTKTGGLPWADDAGAISTKQLTAGDGYVELTISDTTTFRMIGLTHAHSGTTSGDIDYAFRLQSGYASPYEHGAWRLDGQMAGGDTLRIAVESGQVKFYRNGGLVYTSAIAPTYPLFVAASMIDAGGTITGTRLGLPSSPPAGTTFLSEPTAQPSAGGATVAWTTPVAAGGDVDYGPTVAYGTRAHDPAVGTQHQVTLSGLTGGTLYHYRVVSTDGAGNTVTSADRTLTAGAGSASRAHRFCGWTLADGYEDPSADPGYTTFAAHADSFDAVHPVWWHLGADMLTFTRVYGEGDATITQHTTAAGQPTQLIPTIAAVDGSEPSRVAAMLGNATARSQHAAAIRDLVVSKNYDGIDLDYEHLSDPTARASARLPPSSAGCCTRPERRSRSPSPRSRHRRGRTTTRCSRRWPISCT